MNCGTNLRLHAGLLEDENLMARTTECEGSGETGDTCSHNNSLEWPRCLWDDGELKPVVQAFTKVEEIHATVCLLIAVKRMILYVSPIAKTVGPT